MAVVEYEVQDGIARIVLNRPERLNALNEEVSERLRTAARDADRDPAVRAVVITGAGERAFSSGFDLRGDRVAPGGPELIGEGEEYAPWSILKIRKPVIAAIRGYALAGGLDIALACDIRIAADNASLGFPEVHWNLPDGFAVALLTRAVPLGHAMDLILRAQRIDAEHAHRIGLVNEVVPSDQLMTRVDELARQMAAQAPLAIRAMKEMAYESLHADLDKIMASQGKFMRLLGLTEDAIEGRQAFPERREPEYHGR